MEPRGWRGPSRQYDPPTMLWQRFLLGRSFPRHRRCLHDECRQPGRRRRPMTPEERKLVTDLFDRLATVEDAQRDPDAERLMKDGLRQAPNALYALVQTVLVQDEALKRADGRIRELEQTLDDIDQQQQPPPRDTSFLGGVRDSLLGRR